jgi:hypothetical protein
MDCELKEYIAKLGLSPNLVKELESKLIKNSKIGLHNPNEFPLKQKGETFSVDVIIIDEFGLLGIAAYDFESSDWIFHTDTLIDYKESGHETKWKWFYSPVNKEMI